MFERLEPLIKAKGIKRLKNATVMVIGLGGVGAYAVEALARSGVGRLIIVDGDHFEVSDLNRQLPALHSTLGKKKTDVTKNRIADINPTCEVIAHPVFYANDTKERIFNQLVDFVFDAIDQVPAKVDIIKTCCAQHIPIIISCGQGNRMHPEQLEIIDLKKTSIDPLARVLRQKLRDVKCKMPCIISKELPLKSTPPFVASNAFVPASAGLLAASYIIQQLIGDE